MLYEGRCSCSLCSLVFKTEKTLSVYQPRVCDCAYCAKNPSKLISELGTAIEVSTMDSEDLVCKRNGDFLADFYHCKNCDDLMVIGKKIEGVLRGALNAALLDDCSELGKIATVQPRLLSSVNKLERWKRVWSRLHIQRGPLIGVKAFDMKL